jgi:hypothetical protein
MVYALVLSYRSLLKKIHNQNRPVCRSIVAKEKPTVGSPFFGAFPSDRIPKLMNDVNVHFLFTTIPVNYTSELMERT